MNAYWCLIWENWLAKLVTGTLWFDLLWACPRVIVVCCWHMIMNSQELVDRSRKYKWHYNSATLWHSLYLWRDAEESTEGCIVGNKGDACWQPQAHALIQLSYSFKMWQMKHRQGPVFLLKQKYVKEMTLINPVDLTLKIPNLLLKKIQNELFHTWLFLRGALLLWIDRHRWYLSNETIVGFPKEGSNQNEC